MIRKEGNKIYYTVPEVDFNFKYEISMLVLSYSINKFYMIGFNWQAVRRNTGIWKFWKGERLRAQHVRLL